MCEFQSVCVSQRLRFVHDQLDYDQIWHWSISHGRRNLQGRYGVFVSPSLCMLDSFGSAACALWNPTTYLVAVRVRVSVCGFHFLDVVTFLSHHWSSCVHILAACDPTPCTRIWWVPTEYSFVGGPDDMCSVIKTAPKDTSWMQNGRFKYVVGYH